MYYDFAELVHKLPSHRILAINRGEAEDFLKVSIEKPTDKILYYIQKDIIKYIRKKTAINRVFTHGYSGFYFYKLSQNLCLSINLMTVTV